MNQRSKMMFSSLEIQPHVVGIEAHQSNGRVKGVVRTIRDGILRLGDG